MTGIRLGEELEAKLNEIAASLQRPKSSLIREAIRDKLEDWEDLKAVIDSYRDDEKRWTLNEVMQAYSVRVDDMEG